MITGTNLQKDEINRLGAIRFAQETNQELTDFFSDDSVRVPAGSSKKKSITWRKTCFGDIRRDAESSVGPAAINHRQAHCWETELVHRVTSDDTLQLRDRVVYDSWTGRICL